MCRCGGSIPLHRGRSVYHRVRLKQAKPTPGYLSLFVRAAIRFCLVFFFKSGAEIHDPVTFLYCCKTKLTRKLNRYRDDGMGHRVLSRLL